MTPAIIGVIASRLLEEGGGTGPASDWNFTGASYVAPPSDTPSPDWNFTGLSYTPPPTS